MTKNRTMLRNAQLSAYRLLVIAAAALVFGSACSGSNDNGPAAATPAADASGEPAVATATPPSDADLEAAVAYVQRVNAFMDEVAITAAAVAAVMTEAEIDSASWRSDATTALSAFTVLRDRAERLLPGPETQHIQDRVLVATERFEHVATLLTDSIESLDLERLTEASIALNDALLAAAEVRELINEFSAS